ncbi:LysE family translocator [Paenibacillus albidus]|uniref:LysE family translocator n=1 Tax=Paenibacillus albidus TaxID=2041023 RepID=A0A917CME4_9BACL|nr:LysE family translocator [Paenibacillus albidus]GGF92669.1 LysE family translocator [Paenibacillus albidus]
MEIMSILAFLGTAVLLTLMPGPDNLFVLAQSIAQGKKAGIATTFGLCTGLLVHITAATLGISALIYQSALAFTLVKYAGACYLLFLAYKSFKAKDSELTVDRQESQSIDLLSLYRKGILMNILNPKVSLFFLALLPPFVNQSAGHVSLQMLLLGVVFLLQALVIFFAISVFSGKVRVILLKNPRVSRKINLIQGTLLGIIGLKVAFSGK